MSIQSEIDRIAGAKTTLGNYLQQNGVAVPSGATVDEMALQLADVIGTKSQEKTVNLSMASGNQVITPDDGYTLSKVTVTKPDTLIPDNIKKDVNIGGVVGSMSGGSAPSLQSKSVTYTANGTATITPDDGYDGLSSVDVTVDVSGGGSIGEIFRGEVIPTKETPPSELFVTLPNGEQMTITNLFSLHVNDIWNKIVLNGDAVSFSIINTTDSHVYTGTQIKQINIDFYINSGNKAKRAWRRCLNGASYSSIADTLCFKTGSKYVYYWI